jgi:hypothetical protein
MRIDHYIHLSPEIEHLLRNLGGGNIIAAINRTETRIMAVLTPLQNAVAAQSTVIDSAITLIDGLQDAVANLSPTQEAIDALAAEIDTKRTALANAMLENTPAPPAEPAP